MSNYNTQLQSNNIDLQEVLQILQTKAAGSGEQATPVISIGSSGLITATAGTKSATKQLAFQPAKTITPSTASQIAVSSGYYTGGDITVAGDSNLKATNIRSGISIFGITGTLDDKKAEWSANEDSIVSGKIQEYTNDRVTEVGDYAFALRHIKSVNFPICKTIYRNAFASCYQLSSVNFPKCTNIWSYAFFLCHHSSFISVSFPACTSIASYAFCDCYNLSQFYLTGSSVCTLLNSNAFNNTPYAGYSNHFSGTPYIYVPASLVDTYKTATNWTYFSSYFSAVEGEDNLIRFTIEGFEYQAEQGMTWAEWIESEYNSIDCYILNNKIHYYNGDPLKDVNSRVTQEASSIISNNGIYET